MNKKTVTFSVALSGLMLLTSCVKEVMNEMPVETTSRLKVITRAPGEDPLTIATPIQVYVFGDDGRCAVQQTIDGDDALTPISLAEGAYDVYALGGVDNVRYALPVQEEIRSNTEIHLREGKVLDDLMTASAHVSLADGEEKQLTLAMERKVVLLSGITIRNVPEDVTAVSVTIQPLNESILLNGTLTGSDGQYTLSLTEQNDGTTWKSASNIYLFPPAQRPTISVAFEQEDGTKSYTYVCKDNLEANYKLSIEGTYHAEQGVTISGVVTGTDWEGEKTINLTFDEKTGETTGKEDNEANSNTGNNNNNEGGDTSENTLKVGSSYKDCYVLAVDGKNVTLLSKEEKNGVVQRGCTQEKAKSDISFFLNRWNVAGIDATWVVPDEAILGQYLESHHENGKRYLCLTDDTTLGYIYYGGNGVIVKPSLNVDDILLRPITTITIE